MRFFLLLLTVSIPIVSFGSGNTSVLNIKRGYRSFALPSSGTEASNKDPCFLYVSPERFQEMHDSIDPESKYLEIDDELRVKIVFIVEDQFIIGKNEDNGIVVVKVETEPLDVANDQKEVAGSISHPEAEDKVVFPDDDCHDLPEVESAEAQQEP